jgi:hypothetical protein
MRAFVWVLAVSLSAVAFAKPTEAEKQKQKAEKKLEAFVKEYDPEKKLANKAKELEKDVAELDKEIDALAALDASAAGELKARRDAAVSSAQQAVGGAAANKTLADFDKKLERFAKDFDPEKKNVLNVDAKSVERARKELDELIARLDGDAKAACEKKRDELFARLDSGVASAKLDKLRKFIEAPPPVAPIAGVEAIKPMRPTWCDGVLESMGAQLANYTAPIPREWQGALSDGLVFSCLDADWDVRQQVMAAYRQKLSNALGIDAATNERLLKLGAKLLVMKDTRPLVAALCSQQLEPLAEGTAAARANRALERIAVRCGNQRSDENAMRLIDLDAPGALTSQLAMASLTNLLLENGEPDEYPLRRASDVAVLNTLAFDAAQFEQQLRALKLNEHGEALALLAYYGARARLQRFVTVYRGLEAKVPGLQKLVFDAPAAAAKNYLATRAEKDRPVLELIQAMEAQPGNVDGCTRKLWPMLKNELRGQGKKAVSALEINGLLAWALAECARRDGEVPGLEPIFSSFAERTTAVRGPLTAAYLAYVDTFNEQSSGSAKRAFDPGKRSGSASAAPTIPEPRQNPLGEAQLSMSRFGTENSMRPSGVGSGGVVKSVEKKGELARITFRAEKFMVPDLNCVETNRIERILPDGQIRYRVDCTKVGEHEESATPEPFELPAWAAEGVSAGSYVMPLWMSLNSEGKGRAWIVEAYDSKARGKRTSLFGLTPQ